jgi:plasmid stability protein
MAQLVVRDLEPELVGELKVRAARHGRSMEAEHREILRTTLGRGIPRRDLKGLLLAMPEVGDDADFARPRQKARRVEL